MSWTSKTITAKYTGQCSYCGQPFQAGETIAWYPLFRSISVHPRCNDAMDQELDTVTDEIEDREDL